MMAMSGVLRHVRSILTEVPRAAAAIAAAIAVVPVVIALCVWGLFDISVVVSVVVAGCVGLLLLIAVAVVAVAFVGMVRLDGLLKQTAIGNEAAPVTAGNFPTQHGPTEPAKPTVEPTEPEEVWE
jgi:hypothetical protein